MMIVLGVWDGPNAHTKATHAQVMPIIPFQFTLYQTVHAHGHYPQQIKIEKGNLMRSHTNTDNLSIFVAQLCA